MNYENELMRTIIRNCENVVKHRWIRRECPLLKREQEGAITDLTEKEAAELIIESEKVMQAIRDGEMEGDYYEF